MTDDAAAPLAIARLGAQGDGIADSPAGPRYVPFALPGERVHPAADGGLPEVVSAPSSERRAPLCRHFGVCGGCAAQHMSDSLYAEWKRGIVVEAFRQRKLSPEIAPLRRVAPGTRRRAVMTARAARGSLVLGYHRRGSHDLFDLQECPVLVPGIVERLDGLRRIVSALAAREARLTLLATPAGLDVTIQAGRRIGPREAMRLAQLAASHRIARIVLDGETIVQRAAPTLAFAGVATGPPPGGFVQAVAQAEEAIAGEVTAATRTARRMADLFCGAGALTFHLARTASVLAVDSDKEAIDALKSGAHKAQGLKPIETRVRDLVHDPLSPRELEGFGAVVFDPPRAGAKAQAEQLARSQVPVVVAVSCNPGTLARDVSILADGGYLLERVTPIDQFLFAPHVEAVAILRRP